MPRFFYGINFQNILTIRSDCKKLRVNFQKIQTINFRVQKVACKFSEYSDNRKLRATRNFLLS